MFFEKYTFFLIVMAVIVAIDRHCKDRLHRIPLSLRSRQRPPFRCSFTDTQKETIRPRETGMPGTRNRNGENFFLHFPARPISIQVPFQPASSKRSLGIRLQPVEPRLISCVSDPFFSQSPRPGPRATDRHSPGQTIEFCLSVRPGPAHGTVRRESF